MKFVSVALQIIVVVSLAIFIYSRIKKQSIKETLEEIKDILGLNKDG